MSAPDDFQDRMLALGLGRVAEKAALATEDLIGRGDERAADKAAGAAMETELSRLDLRGTVVIGETDTDRMGVGASVGNGDGPELDVAVDPLEGTTLAAKDLPNAMSVIAMAPKGSITQVPNIYMEKLAFSGTYAPDTVTLDMTPTQRIEALAKAKGCAPKDVTVCMLERARHMPMIDELRDTGAAVRLITDGDISAVINCAEPEDTGIDMYMGSGGAPEGVLAAAALKCLDGHFYGQLIYRNEDERHLARSFGNRELDRVYTRDELVTDHVIFAATGVTNSSLLRGMIRAPRYVQTETLLMRSKTGSIRRMSYRIPRTRS